MTFKLKFQAHVYLIICNALISMLIACRYFAFLPELPTDVLGFSFLVCGTFSHMATLSFLMGFILLPVLFLTQTPRRLLQSGVATFALILLVIDTFVYSQYRFHINAVMLELVMSGQVVKFPLSTWFMVITGIILLWCLEYLLILKLEKASTLKQWNISRKFAWLTLVTLLATHSIHVWAAAHVYQPVTVVKRYLPLFYPMTSNKTMKKLGWMDEKAIATQKAMSLQRKSDVNYPLHPLQASPVSQPKNIMFIVVDSWRADTFNAENAPNMWYLAQKGQIFNQHYSTGNCTRTGIFGMFYAIPGTYWQGILVNQQSPVFIDRLQALNYQMGIFAAAKLTNPEFDQTVFSKIPNLRTHSTGDSSVEIDQSMTQDWLNWYAKQDKNKPKFSFLFYDSPHGYDFPKDYPKRFEPMLNEINYLKLNNDTDRHLMLNRYKTSVHYVDSLVKKVIDKLEETGDLKNTVIVITGDHGQEINDNMDNFWGHNGNYTDPQIKVPFAIITPDGQQRSSWNANTLTSHQDIVPTLMKHYLGVDNPIQDYAVGEDLLGNEVKRDWILASNYSSYAVITPKNILEVGAVGQYDMLDKKNRPLKDQQPNPVYLQAALEQISRFNK
ncbi:DUF3413 domain-containing protein [Acinetobacter sp. 194]|uniref:DUF3413 domain-containing protein n=1 Tax=Acinetobacter shaoyimingii TaxID=2715164 RepID=UPI00140DA928|nr:DUF3413 domain-containing protein [Acinetobacter shaoyimingii]NHB59258.1 DUF3413 domain-containing protein [Acinetobacter shaoyimingii]